MKILSSALRFVRFPLLGALGVSLAMLSGCSMGPVLGGSGQGTMASSFGGTLHGGPNPVVGARVVMYATTSNGYGTGQFLQEAVQQGASLHQDTDANGFFHFAGAYTCPAGQYAYMVAYGGNTGANANNPNSMLMAAMGPCSSLYTGTTYTGSNVWIDELTTVAAGYALSNFLNVTGDAVNGFTVGVGADAANNATTGCVNNTYYNSGSSTCSATAAPGLRDAFNNAISLVSNVTGTANTATPGGALVPTPMINTLGNVLQACVNSTGGGSNGTGAATSSPTANDGTPCGKLFAYTSYSTTAATGEPGAGTVTNSYPTNTLSAMQNLAKRPASNGTMWDAGCATPGTANSGITCIFNLSSPTSFYNTAMTGAPTDYTMVVSYPKGSLGATTQTGTCNGASVAFAGLVYPYHLATDIDDNITVLNSDSSNSYCYSVLTLTNGGTPIGMSPVFNSGTTKLALKFISTDAFGHAIVPSGGADLVNVYAAGSADTTIGAPVSVSTGSGSAPTFTAVESNGDIYTGGQGTVSNFHKLTAGSTNHATPTYADSIVGTAALTSKLFQMNVDINGNVWTNNSSSSVVAIYSYVPGAANYVKTGGTGSSSNGSGNAPDSNGNEWVVLQDYQSGATTAQTDVYKYAYTQTDPATLAISPESLVATVTPNAASQTNVAMDGSNTLWWGDYASSNNGLHGYDTVSNYTYGTLFGCKFASGQTQCGDQNGSTSSTPFDFYATRGVAVDAAGSIWVTNGSQGALNQVIGLGSPTYPLFIHNGSTLKP